MDASRCSTRRISLREWGVGTKPTHSSRALDFGAATRVGRHGRPGRPPRGAAPRRFGHLRGSAPQPHRSNRSAAHRDDGAVVVDINVDTFRTYEERAEYAEFVALGAYLVGRALRAAPLPATARIRWGAERRRRPAKRSGCDRVGGQLPGTSRRADLSPTGEWHRGVLGQLCDRRAKGAGHAR